MATFGGRDYSDKPADTGAQGPQGGDPRGTQGAQGGQGSERGYPADDPRGYQQPQTREEYNREADRGNAGRDRNYDDRGYGDRGGGGYRDDRGGGGQRGGGGRGGGRSGGYDRDPNYAFISYLYAAKNGSGGYTVFLKREMLDILKDLEEDDILGISPSGRDGWAFYARRVPAEDKDAYRRGGGGGGGRGNRGGGRGGGRGRY